MKRANIFLLLGVCAGLAHAGPPAENAAIEAFNAAMTDATRRMDTAATLKLWEESGVSLLPSTPPIAGKPAIARFLHEVTAQTNGAHMVAFDMQCFDIAVAGDWASEWCREHQIIDFPLGKPRFEGWGKMLLVLHRDANGDWRLAREMWNQDVAAGR